MPNAKLLALNDAIGAAIAMPVPSNVVAKAPDALEVMDRDAVRAAATVGLNVTLMVQLAPAAKVAAQVDVLAKSLEFAPLIAIALIFNTAEALVFFSVTS